MIQALLLEERQIEFIRGKTVGHVTREGGMTLDGRKIARPATFIGDPVLFANAQREMRIMVEEKRGDVVVVDEEQHVGTLLGEPLLDRFVTGEDGRPHRILLLLRVEREADGGRV